MPEVLSFLPLLFGGGGGSAPKPATPTPKEQQVSALKTRQTQETALSSQLPGLQAATGGSLSPETLLRLAEVLSGQAGTPGIGASLQDLLMKMTQQNSVTAGSGGGGGGSSSGLTLGGTYA